MASTALGRASGLYGLTIGAEASSEETLRAVRKGTRPEGNLGAVRELDPRGIHPRMSYIVGYPGEERESMLASLDETRRITLECPRARTDVWHFRPIPGTVDFQRALEQGCRAPTTLEGWAGVGDYWNDEPHRRPVMAASCAHGRQTPRRRLSAIHRDDQSVEGMHAILGGIQRRSSCAQPARPAPCHGSRSRCALRPRTFRSHCGACAARIVALPFLAPENPPHRLGSEEAIVNANDGWQRWGMRAGLGLATFGIVSSFLVAIPAPVPMQAPAIETLQERIAALEMELADLQGPPATAGELRRQLQELRATLDRSGRSGPWSALTALGLGVLATGYLAYAKATAERTARTELLLKYAAVLNKKADLGVDVAREASIKGTGKPRGPQQDAG